MGRSSGTIAVVVLLLLAMLSGCIFAPEEEKAPEEDEISYPPIWDRHALEWDTSGTYSLVLEPGPYSPLDVQEAMVAVDTSAVWETGPSTSEVHISYWLPNNTLLGEQVPVIAVVSPYFSYGQQGDESTPTNVVGAGRGVFIFDNFVPHGYALSLIHI